MNFDRFFSELKNCTVQAPFEFLNFFVGGPLKFDFTMLSREERGKQKEEAPDANEMH